jgi:phospholipid-translocating ATPase
MVFRKCTIGGKIYNGGAEMDVIEEEVKDLRPLIVNQPEIIKDADKLSSTNVQALAPPAEDIPSSSFRSSGSSTAVQQPSSQHPDPHAAHPTGPDGPGILDPLESRTVRIPRHFYDPELAQDLQRAVNAEPESTNAAHARNLNGFFTVLALCHTVLTSVDPETGAIEYKAQSPDEAALVQAAADMGFIFRGRDREVLLLQTPFSVDEDGEEVLERYELLNILEFTSVRKRMSVVLRKMDSDDERIFLLTKGADNVIFERLKKGGGEETETLKKATEKYLDEFAGQGLRTLTLAYKVIGGAFPIFDFGFLMIHVLMVWFRGGV